MFHKHLISDWTIRTRKQLSGDRKGPTDNFTREGKNGSTSENAARFSETGSASSWPVASASRPVVPPLFWAEI
jgi:hypothetical protein